MFLERVYEGKNDISRWFAMLIIVLMISQLAGWTPLKYLISMQMSLYPELQPNPENRFDLSAYDIAPITGFVLMLIPMVLGFFSLVLLMKPIHERPFLSVVTAQAAFRWKRFFWGASVWFILMVILAFLAAITGLQQVELQFNPQNLLILAAVSVVLIPFQTGFEELFFRGYLMQGFSQIFKYKWLTLLLISLVYGGFHLLNPGVKEYGDWLTLPQYILFGIVFGVCTLMDEGIEIAWGMHAINNIFLAVFINQDLSTLPTPALFRITAFNPLFELIALFLFSLLFIYLARNKFHWPQWSHLLDRVNSPVTPEGELTDYLEDEYDDE